MTIHQIINDIELAQGGAQKVARMLHTEYLSRGRDARLVSLIDSNANGVAAYRSLHLSRPYDYRAIARLGRYLRQECKPGDVVHTHLFPTSLYTSIASRLVRWRGALLFTEHSTSNGRRGTWRGWVIDRSLYPRFNGVACISRGTRDALAAWMPSLSERLAVVENGVPLVFEQVPERAVRDKPVIVSAGRLIKAKNYDTALRAIASLQEQPFEYRIAGAGPEEGELRRLCTELNLDDRVRFLGYVEDVPQLLREADILLMPSRWEGFGLSAAEAMNAGLPVVASDVDGLREIVGGTPPCGILVDPSDPASIARGLKELLVDPDKRRSHGQAGHERSQQFSLDRMVDKYLEFYKRL